MNAEKTNAEKVNAEIENRRSLMAETYVEQWSKATAQWKAADESNSFWLIYAANYLFNTKGVKWAIDPLRANRRLPKVPQVDAARDLRDLQTVILTHWHGDHIDPELWAELADTDCHWIVPDHFVERFRDIPGLKDARVTVAIPEREITLPGITILPFESLHNGIRLDGSPQIVDETGYYIESGGKSMLFPVDVRTYKPGFLKRFTRVDADFAHVFLGRSAALLENPPQLDAFVDFHLACEPDKIFLTHLYEVSRSVPDIWRKEHARLVIEKTAALNGDIEISAPNWFEQVSL